MASMQWASGSLSGAPSDAPDRGGAATPPAWLADIQLITFDCFGTLIDWRAGAGAVELDDDAEFARFLDACRGLERADKPGPWAACVKEAIRGLRPALRPAVIGLFADDLGRQPAFADVAPALPALQALTRVGVLANSDPSHQIEVATGLRFAFDLVVTSADLRACKPLDRAWDAAVRMAVARSALPRDAWLHISAFGKLDLEPARARGVRTCHLRRRGGDDRAAADLSVGGLAELVELLSKAKRGPIVIESEVCVADAAAREGVRRYLTERHLPALRAVPGVRAARLYEYDDGRLVDQVVFGGELELAAYEEAFAAEQRVAFATACGRELVRTSRRALLRAQL